MTEVIEPTPDDCGQVLRLPGGQEVWASSRILAADHITPEWPDEVGDRWADDLRAYRLDTYLRYRFAPDLTPIDMLRGIHD